MAVSSLLRSVGPSLAIDTIVQTGGPQTACASANTEMGTILWFGGQITFGVALTDVMLGVMQTGSHSTACVPPSAVTAQPTIWPRSLMPCGLKGPPSVPRSCMPVPASHRKAWIAPAAVWL